MKHHDEDHMIDKLLYCGRIDMWYMRYITKTNITDYHQQLTSYPFTTDLP